MDPSGGQQYTTPPFLASGSSGTHGHMYSSQQPLQHQQVSQQRQTYTTVPPIQFQLQHHSPQQSLPVHKQQSPHDDTDRARAYKSRNKRPCDFCRYKKAACHLENRPPCELCIRYGKECTFVESPAKRRRPNDQADRPQPSDVTPGFEPEVTVNQGHGAHVYYMPGSGSAVNHSMPNMSQDYLHWSQGVTPYNMSSMSSSPAMMSNFGNFDPAGYPIGPMSAVQYENHEAVAVGGHTSEQTMVMRGDTQQYMIPTAVATNPVILPGLQLPFAQTSGEASLDNQAQSNSQIVGVSGEADPYLLTRFRFDERKEAHFQSIRVRTMYRQSPTTDSATIPTFFRISHNALASKAQPPERVDVLDRYRRDVDTMVSPDIGKRLIGLFYLYVQPYFPILTRDGGFARDADGIQDLSKIPTCILAAIYGHALAFCAWDGRLSVQVYTPPSADALFQIAWLACLPYFHTPTLAVLQTLLLLVQRRPTNKHVGDTPFKWTMITTAVGIAQTLGINRDPSAWPIPVWEIKLRKRLAWATYIQDKWIALNFGRSSHIQSDDWDLVLLQENDFIDKDEHAPDSGHITRFTALCTLAQLVDQITHQLCSLRAVRHLQGTAGAAIEVAESIFQSLDEWHSVSLADTHRTTTAGNVSSPPNMAFTSLHELDGSGSLRLAYLTAKVELFRAMLRPDSTKHVHEVTPSIRTRALSTGYEILAFVEGLNARELEAFWASYSRTNFTIASSFMLLLFVTAPTIRDASDTLRLLDMWRAVLRLKSRSCDMLNLALLRIDSAFVSGLDRLIDLTPAAAQVWAESNRT